MSKCRVYYCIYGVITRKDSADCLMGNYDGKVIRWEEDIDPIYFTDQSEAETKFNALAARMKVERDWCGECVLFLRPSLPAYPFSVTTIDFLRVGKGKEEGSDG